MTAAIIWHDRQILRQQTILAKSSQSQEEQQTEECNIMDRCSPAEKAAKQLRIRTERIANAILLCSRV